MISASIWLKEDDRLEGDMATNTETHCLVPAATGGKGKLPFGSRSRSKVQRRSQSQIMTCEHGPAAKSGVSCMPDMDKSRVSQDFCSLMLLVVAHADLEQIV